MSAKAVLVRGWLVAFSLAATLLHGASASAAEPVVPVVPTVSISAPATANAGANFTVTLDYVLPAGAYTPVTVSLQLPVVTPSPSLRRITYVTSTTPGATFTHSEPSPGLHQWTATLDQNQAVTGQILVTCAFPTGDTLDGTPGTMSASLGGTFTPAGGSAQVLNIGPLPATITAQATANLVWHNGEIRGATTWINNPQTGARGFTYTMDFRMRNDGPGSIDAYDWTITAGSGLYFVKAYARLDNDVLPPVPPQNDPVIDVLTVPPDWTTQDQQGGTLPGVPFKAAGVRRLYVPGGPGASHSAHIYIQFFVPCSAVPVLASNAAYKVTAVAHGTQNTYAGTIEHQATVVVGAAGEVQGNACGTGGSFSKGWAHAEYGVDSAHYWVVSVTPPKSIFPLHNVMIVDRMYADVDSVLMAGVSSEFTMFFCAAMPGETFGEAGFWTHVDNGVCDVDQGSLIGDLTHWVAWGPTVGAQGLSSFGMVGYLNVGPGFLDGKTSPFTATNSAYMNAEADLDGNGSYEVKYGDQLLENGATNPDIWEDSRTVQVVHGSQPRIEVFTYATLPAPARVIGPGQTTSARFRFAPGDNYYEDPINQTFEITPPAGVKVLSVVTHFETYVQCNPKPVDWFEPTDLSAPTLVWKFGSDAHPYVQNYYCMNVEVTFGLDPFVAVANGKVLTFTAHTSAKNDRFLGVPEPDGNGSDLVTELYTASVPGEMRVGVVPDCDGDSSTPAFRITSQNTGGLPLTATVTTFKVPRVSDGTATGRDTRFAGITATLGGGASIQVETGGVFIPYVPFRDDDNATITAVRVQGVLIDVGAPASVFTVKLSAPSGVADEEIYGTAVMRSTTLPNPATSANGQPFIIGLCPGTLELTKFFDRNHDGAVAFGEPPLVGWSFEIAAAASPTVLVATLVSDLDGNVTLDLLPGDYTIREILPASGNWLEPVGGSVRTIAILDSQTTRVSFGNACTCVQPTAACMVATCNPNGSCTTAAVTNGTSCLDGDLCTGSDTCFDGTCTAGPSILPPGPCDSNDSDKCENGAWQCAAGVVTCDETLRDLAEVCGGGDEDCDGLFDGGDPSLTLVECDLGDGVCAGAMKSRLLCITPEAGDAYWDDCSEADYAGHAYPFEYVSPEDDLDTCDGDDNDCSDGIDEDFEEVVACSDGLGVCKRDGVLRCGAGGVVACTVQAGPARLKEECGNAKDDDCDGITDEGFAFVGQPCDADDRNATIEFDTDLCANDVIACDDDDNSTTTCKPLFFAVERCDGLDNNCDRAVDETFKFNGLAIGAACDGDDNGTCARGIVGCDGPTGTRCDETGVDPTTIVCSVGLGACVRNGHLRCDSTCDAAVVLGSAERCDNEVDDDCDGDINEGFLDIGDDCDSNTTDTDLCKNDKVECLGATTGCVQKVATQLESCDGQDNNCDTFTDEPFKTLDTACDSNAADGDSCANDVYRCAPGGDGVVCDEVIPARVEVCNGVDDDCNEGTDEGLDFGACTAGVGVCKRDGRLTCIAGGVACAAQAGPARLKEECGNALDDDCDGAVDEGFQLVGQPCDADDRNATIPFDTDLCANDMIVCDPDDNATTACTPVMFAVEVCDGKDNNCDKFVDETFVGGEHPLGAACDGGDGDSCKEGVWVCDGPNATRCDDDSNNTIERCNGLDDNCDREIDEAWPTLGDPCDGSNDADSCANGTLVCNATFDEVACLEVGLAVVELCNGRDDTCDCDPLGADPATCDDIGVGIDEGFQIGAACTTADLGICKTAGAIACATTTTTTCVATAPVTRVAESCNGLDDDCDGHIDNGTGGVIVCTPLDTDVVSGPVALTSATSASFTYINPQASPVQSHTTFQCSLDGGAWVACDGGAVSVGLPASTVRSAALSAGTHTLLVRATRIDGAFDTTPDFWSWTVDTTIPDTVILSAPTNPSQGSSGTIVVGAAAGVPGQFYCALDPANGVCPAVAAAGVSAGYTACDDTYTYTGVADGAHLFCVYMTDTKGDVDPLPASYAWVIDTTAPETAIDATPPKVTSTTSATLKYSDPDAPDGDVFECSLDGGDWVDCDGKMTSFSGLAEGEHRFEVRAIDGNGVVDPTPASYTWTVDRTAACATIALSPSDPAQSGSAVFGFAAGEGAVRYFCALDPAPGGASGPALSVYAACEATTRFDGLADGAHRLWVYALDAAGNVGTCRATFAWTIDRASPETEIGDGPTALIGDGEVATIAYADPNDADRATFECRLDGAAWARCDGVAGDGGSIDYAELAVGAHVFEVRTCDFDKAPAIQCDPTPARVQWQVTVSPCPNDATAPVLQCAADLLLECEAGGAEVDLVELGAVATDTCSAVVGTSASASVGLGQTPLVFVATDANGNESSCVTLVDVVDVTAPRITCPADILVATTDPGVCGASLAIAHATGNDACEGEVGLLVLDDAPEQFGPGETSVTHHVVDRSGNAATCRQKVVVRDDEALVIVCSPAAEVDASADACAWAGTHTASATDNCSDAIAIDVVGTYPVGESRVLFKASDAAGNADECETLLTVRDVTAPVVACGSGGGRAPGVVRASATDACGAVIAIEGVACTRVAGGVREPMPLESCPVVVHADMIEVTGGPPDGMLELAYDVRAVDPSGNFHVTRCGQTWWADRDGDGVADGDDNCALLGNVGQQDGDDDGIGDACDACPALNDDGVGGACADKDEDGVLEAVDNCELVANADQDDLDEDGIGDACDVSNDSGYSASGGGAACSGAGGGLAFGLLGLALVGLVRRRRA